MANVCVVSIGEILWDVMPSGRYLGGAPFNVAGHLARLGCSAQLISRVGNDDSGASALTAARELGIDVSLMQIDDRHPTGEASIVFNDSGSADFSFLSPAAWDFIEPTDASMRAVAQADAIIFGTLAQRTPQGRRAIRELIESARYRIFDPNLRSPHVDRDLTIESMMLADLIKVSEEECGIIADWLGVAGEPEALLDALSRSAARGDRPPPEICITYGSQGASYFAGSQWHREPAVLGKVADTVGAGDAFLSMLVAQRLRQVAPDIALRRATNLAGYVVSQPGAVPSYDARRFLES